jgi:hypothetical protein
MYDNKIVIIVRADLKTWQKLNIYVEKKVNKAIDGLKFHD